MARSFNDCLSELKAGGALSDEEFARLRDDFENRRNQHRTKLDLKKLDAYKPKQSDYDEAPEPTKTQLAEAVLVKRGRPKLDNPNEAIKLRLDADVLAAYRSTGAGWQTRINSDLRKAAKKLPVA